MDGQQLRHSWKKNAAGSLEAWRRWQQGLLEVVLLGWRRVLQQGGACRQQWKLGSGALPGGGQHGWKATAGGRRMVAGSLLALLEGGLRWLPCCLGAMERWQRMVSSKVGGSGAWLSCCRGDGGAGGFGWLAAVAGQVAYEQLSWWQRGGEGAASNGGDACGARWCLLGARWRCCWSMLRLMGSCMQQGKLLSGLLCWQQWLLAMEEWQQAGARRKGSLAEELGAAVEEGRQLRQGGVSPVNLGSLQLSFGEDEQ